MQTIGAGRTRAAHFVRTRLLDPPHTLRVAAAVWVLGVIAIAVGLLPRAHAFMKHTKATFRPPAGSITEASERFIDRWFLFLNPAVIEQALINVVVSSTDGRPLFDTHTCPPAANRSGYIPPLPNMSWPIRRGRFRFGAPFQESATCTCVRNWTRTIAEYPVPLEILRSVKGYFLPLAVLPVVGPRAYLSRDRRSTLIALNVPFNEKIGKDMGKALLWLIADSSMSRPRSASRVDEHGFAATVRCMGQRTLRVEVSSTLLSISEMESSVIGSLVRIDEVSLPVAIFLLVVATRSVRLTIVPLIALPVCFVLVFASLRPYEETHALPPMLPEMVVALMVALNLDFSLFLNTRFREAHRQLVHSGCTSELVDTLRAWPVVPTAAQQYRAPHEHTDIAADTDDDDESNTIPPHIAQLAVVMTATTSCMRNIGFSGFTIAAVFGALAATANDGLIRMPAVACMAAAAGSCAVALLVIPPLLYLCFTPLTAPIPSPCQLWHRRQQRVKGIQSASPLSTSPRGPPAAAPSEISMATDAPLLYGESASPRSGDGLYPALHTGKPPATPTTGATSTWVERLAALEPWRALATFAARHPWPIVIGFVAVSAPFVWLCVAYFRYGFSLYSEIPMGSALTARMHDVPKTFGAEVANAFYLVFRYPTVSERQHEGGDVSGGRFIAMVTRAIAIAQAQLAVTCPHIPARVTHPFALPSSAGNATTAIARDLLEANAWYHNDTAGATAGTGDFVPMGYRNVAALTIAPKDTYPSLGIAAAAPIQLVADDPWSEAGKCVAQALHNAREDYEPAEAFAGEWVGYFGPNSASFAVSRHVYGAAAGMVASVAATLAVCSLVFFRSVFVSLRLLLTMAWTLVVSFGVAVLCFIVPATRVDDTYMPDFHWFVPVLGFALVTAITLDYDGFVLSRVVEERQRPGTTDAAAVVRAVAVTGSVITFAGAIMCVAFGSLVLSDMLLLRQFAVVIAVSVLLDTFVVRPIFVPALIGTAGRWAWWPRRMPGPTDSEN